MNTNIGSRFILLLCVTVFSAFVAHGETTPLVNYQGKLKKHGTNENGQISITFKVFTGETNSDCVFEETQSVAVADGLYSTLIGKNPTLGNIEDACALDDAYLELSINGTKMKPRERFTPPPFAKKSVQRWSNCIHPSGLTAGSIAETASRVGGYGPVGRLIDSPVGVFPAPATESQLLSANLFVLSWGPSASSNATLTVRLSIYI